jgi:hypothetical protein
MICTCVGGGHLATFGTHAPTCAMVDAEPVVIRSGRIISFGPAPEGEGFPGSYIEVEH